MACPPQLSAQRSLQEHELAQLREPPEGHGLPQLGEVYRAVTKGGLALPVRGASLGI